MAGWTVYAPGADAGEADPSAREDHRLRSIRAQGDLRKNLRSATARSLVVSSRQPPARRRKAVARGARIVLGSCRDGSRNYDYFMHTP